jgi:hypothetical protein
MRKTSIVFIVITIIILFVSGTGCPFFEKNLVSLLYGNGQNASLDQEFILLGNNPKIPGQHVVAISNPDYGLSEHFPRLRAGEKFAINSSTDSDIKYSLAAVTLTPITSPFPPTDQSISDIDPEVDMTFSTPITLGSYHGEVGSFVIPQRANPGYYLVYAYLQYPALNMTAVYNTLVQITTTTTGISPTQRPAQ